MIHTREQLVWEIREIILKNINLDIDKFSLKSAEEIADLISTLNDDEDKEWKTIP